MAINFNKIFDNIPLMTLGNGNVERWNRIADWVSRPAQNRAIMGFTALGIQPVIDRNNKRVSQDTRETSAIRTTAKAAVGMGVGIAVRQPCYDFVQACTSPEGKKKYSHWLLPKSKLAGLKENNPWLKNHRIFISTFLSLIIMGFGTNFLVDAPLTIFATNKMLAHREKHKAAEKKEGLDVNA